MGNVRSDVYQFKVNDHESLGFPEGHARSLELYRDTVVKPSLRALDQAIANEDASEEPAAEFFRDELLEMFPVTVAGYILTVQSMWERGLREMLERRDERLNAGTNRSTLRKARWPDLNSQFPTLIGVELSEFDSYKDLDFLQNLANAIRHGDGPAAARVHEMAPDLWWFWHPPGTTIEAGPFKYTTPENGPPHPPFGHITLPEIVLDQMIQSVIHFWTDLEFIRCNSFSRRNESTVRQLTHWAEQRAQRPLIRCWPESAGKDTRG